MKRRIQSSGPNLPVAFMDPEHSGSNVYPNYDSGSSTCQAAGLNAGNARPSTSSVENLGSCLVPDKKSPIQ